MHELIGDAPEMHPRRASREQPVAPMLLQECAPSLSSQPGQVLSSLQRYSDSMPDVVPSKVRVRVRVRLRLG